MWQTQNQHSAFCNDVLFLLNHSAMGNWLSQGLCLLFLLQAFKASLIKLRKISAEHDKEQLFYSGKSTQSLKKWIKKLQVAVQEDEEEFCKNRGQSLIPEFEWLTEMLMTSMRRVDTSAWRFSCTKILIFHNFCYHMDKAYTTLHNSNLKIKFHFWN